MYNSLFLCFNFGANMVVFMCMTSGAPQKLLSELSRLTDTYIYIANNLKTNSILHFLIFPLASIDPSFVYYSSMYDFQTLFLIMVCTQTLLKLIWTNPLSTQQKKNWGKKKKQFENSLMSFGPKFLNCLHCENLR